MMNWPGKTQLTVGSLGWVSASHCQSLTGWLLPGAQACGLIGSTTVLGSRALLMVALGGSLTLGRAVLCPFPETGVLSMPLLVQRMSWEGQHHRVVQLGPPTDEAVVGLLLWDWVPPSFCHDRKGFLVGQCSSVFPMPALAQE